MGGDARALSRAQGPEFQAWAEGLDILRVMALLLGTNAEAVAVMRAIERHFIQKARVAREKQAEAAAQREAETVQKAVQKGVRKAQREAKTAQTAERKAEAEADRGAELNKRKRSREKWAVNVATKQQQQQQQQQLAHVGLQQVG